MDIQSGLRPKIHLARVTTLVTFLLGGSPSSAKDSSPTAASLAASGLPGLARVATPVEAPRLGIAVTVGYGFIESFGPQPAASHRLVGILGAGYSPLPWLGVGLRLDGHYDRHPADANGNDYTIIGDPRLVLRLRGEIATHFHAGAEAGLWAPGDDAPSINTDALSPEARALFAWVAGDSTVAGHAGYRLDRSSATLEDPSRIRFGDMLSTGVSDYDAVLLGLGFMHDFDGVIATVDISQELLVGSDSPGINESPLLIGLGARLPLSGSLALEGVWQFSPSARPDLARRLVTIPPRASVMVGLRYALGTEIEQAPPVVKPPPPRKKPAPTPPPPPVIDEAPPASTVKGRLTDEGGNPIPDVRVVLTPEEGDGHEQYSDGEGNFEFKDLGYGKYTLRAETGGYDPLHQELQLDSEEPAPLKLTLLPALPAGQVRGMVQSFGGEPLKASLRITPENIELETAEDGTFSVDVPPGWHTVRISAEGYTPQKRRIRVENRGVTVINADLRRSAR